jgi:Protein of unknown function (DUF2783)
MEQNSIKQNSSFDPNLRLTDPDAFYAHLLAAHNGLSDEQSAALNARLLIVLANQIGDTHVLKTCIDAAKT